MEKSLLLIKKEHIDFIVRDGVARYPFEACGLMLGKIGERVEKIKDDSGRKELKMRIFEVKKVREGRNLSDNSIRFILDPHDFLRIQDEADKEGLDIIGVYHTHPDHPPIASQYDIEAAIDGWFYLIVSIYSGKMQGMRGWVLDGEKFVSAQVEILG